MSRFIIVTIIYLIVSIGYNQKSLNAEERKGYENIELSFVVNRAEAPLDIYSIRNTLHLPITSSEAYGAVLLLHSCGGISPKRQNDLVRWGKFLLQNGYAVLFIDHLGPRGIKNNCGRGRPLDSQVLTKDVYTGTAFLKNQPQIDKARIFTLGFSLGAMTGGALANKENYILLGNGTPRPRAVAGLYGGCYGGDKWLDSGADIPVLWLVGGDDKESPPKSCSSAISALQKKKLIEFHEYPNTTHCWDCAGLDGYSKTAGNGSVVTYKFDHEITRDSELRVLKFFNSFKN